jgi:hypothetical protein
MNSSYIRTLTVIVLSLLGVAMDGAESSTYAQIVKQRDEVLSQILREQEGRRAAGHAVEEDVFAAQIALYSFRRDVTTRITEKVEHQQMIVATYEKRLAITKGKYGIGGVANVEVLRATDGVLEAKQLLEDLRAKGKNG